MEKFSTWRDASTGIHPFVPIGSTATSKGWAFVRSYLIAPPLVLLRLVILVLLVAASICAFLLPQIVFFVPAARRLLTRLMTPLLMRLILVVLGFWRVNSEWVTAKKGRSRDSKPVSPFPGGAIGSGALIISNHCSYIDILYLTFRFNAIYASISDNGKVELVPFWRMFWRCMHHDETAQNTSELMTLKNALWISKRDKLGPIVLFAEGTTTNGKGLLVFRSIADNIPRENIHIMGFKYLSNGFSPTFPVGSYIRHFLQLLAEPVNNISVRYLNDSETAELVATSDNDHADKIADLISQFLFIKRVQLDLERKSKFIAFFEEQQGRNKTKTL